MSSNPQMFTLKLTKPEQGNDVITQLAELTHLSKGKLKQVIDKGALWFAASSDNGEPLKPVRVRRLKGKLIKPGEFHLYYDEQVLFSECPEAVLVEDCVDYSIWIKPRGMLSQGSKWGDHTTLKRFVEKNFKPERPAIIVHRLDKMTRGLMIVAHNKKAATSFTRMFENKLIEKRYQAVVSGDTSVLPVTAEIPLDDKVAVSHVTLLSAHPEGHRAVVTVNIETGRKHQIRRHLSEIGLPVVGDRLYGDDSTESDLQLDAVELRFTDPFSGESKQFSISPEFAHD